MVMGRFLVPRMIVIVGTMLARVRVAVVVPAPGMTVGMAVLVAVGVAVHVLVGMAVFLPAVRMGMVVRVLVFVGMVVFVFVVAFHDKLLSLACYDPTCMTAMASSGQASMQSQHPMHMS